MLKLKATKKQRMNDLIERLTIPKEKLQKSQDRAEYNDPIAKFYYRLAKETDNPTLIKKSKNVKDCNRYYTVNKYQKALIKDLLRTNLCTDKFCNNCKKLKQSARINKYKTVLKPYNDVLHHMTLTQPNVKAEDLPQTIEKMSKKFAYLIRYLNGEKKIKDLDFSAFGYQGAIRCLEITFNNKKPLPYHAHYHILIALDHDTDFDNKHIKNKYSRSRHSPDKVRAFSEQEILIQKIWKLLMTDKEVTKKNIDALDIGYACVIDDFDDDDYLELFKYVTKTTDENDNVMTYNNFKTLYAALKDMKAIQAYGVFNSVEDVSKKDLEDAQAQSIYNQVIAFLQERESPVSEVNKLADLIQDQSYKLISRKSLLRVLKDLEDFEDLNIDVPE